MMPFLIGLHVLAAVVWVGGMFFAYVAARPAAAEVLEAPSRLKFWSAAFRRFFVWVWSIVLLLPISGYWMLFGYMGGLQHLGIHIHLMQGLGILMILIFLHLYFAPYRRFRRAVEAADYKTAGAELNGIRRMIATILSLGLLVVAIASAGRYFSL